MILSLRIVFSFVRGNKFFSPTSPDIQADLWFLHCCCTLVSQLQRQTHGWLQHVPSPSLSQLLPLFLCFHLTSMHGYKEEVILHRDGCQTLPCAGRDSLRSVSSRRSPQSPPASHHDLWCQLLACSSRLYCHSYWQAGHFQNISVGRWCIPILAPFWRSLSHHPLDTPWFLSGFAEADTIQLLISSPEALNSNARLPFSFICFSHSTNRASFKWLLLYIHFTGIKKSSMDFRIVHSNRSQLSKATSFPEFADTTNRNALLCSMVFNIQGSKLCCCGFTSLWWKDDGKVNIWKKPQPHKELILFAATCVFQLSLAKQDPDYFGEQKAAKSLNNFLLLKFISRVRYIPGIWAYISKAGYFAEARLTFPASFLSPQLRPQKK